MKVFIVLALVAAATAASVDPIDFSKVVPVYDLPQFWDKYPQLSKYRSNTQGRIVGGDEATPGQFPYMVAVFIHTIDGTGFCGGTMLSNRFVLTAAHCIDMTGVNGFTLVYGAHHIANSGEETQVRVAPLSYVIHQGWDPSVLQNDIALFETKPVELNERIQPIRLPSRSQQGNNFEGIVAVAAGWGRKSDSINEIAPILRHVRQPIITNFQCGLRFLGIIQSTHICMSGDGGRGACSGDSGGPLSAVAADGITIQIGVVSFGLGIGCERGWPSVFTRTTSFLDWIAANSDIQIRP